MLPQDEISAALERFCVQNQWSIEKCRPRTQLASDLLRILHCTIPACVSAGARRMEPAALFAAQRWRTRMLVPAHSSCFAALVAVAAQIGLAGNATAAAVCADHDSIIKALANNYKETRRIMGEVNPDSVMEMFMSPEGTWTMLVTNTKGMTCIAAAGKKWQEVPAIPVGRES
jgi:hypothetical protein